MELASVVCSLGEADEKHMRDCYQGCGTLIAFDVCPHLSHNRGLQGLTCPAQLQALCLEQICFVPIALFSKISAAEE